MSVNLAAAFEAFGALAQASLCAEGQDGGGTAAALVQAAAASAEAFPAGSDLAGAFGTLHAAVGNAAFEWQQVADTYGAGY